VFRSNNISTAADGAPRPLLRNPLRWPVVASRARTVTWNGKDLPPEFLELPAGRYIVEAIEHDVLTLTPREDDAIEAALESYRQGRVVNAKRAREILDAARSH